MRTDVKKLSKDSVKIEVSSDFLKLFVTIDSKEARKLDINSGSESMDNIIKIFSEMSGFNIDLSATGKTEDQMEIAGSVGRLLGSGFRELFDVRHESGLRGSGSSISVSGKAMSSISIDVPKEWSMSQAQIQFERKGRKIFDIDTEHEIPVFLDSFSRGLGADVRVVMREGKKPENLRTCVARSLGETIKNVFSVK